MRRSESRGAISRTRLAGSFRRLPKGDAWLARSQETAWCWAFHPRVPKVSLRAIEKVVLTVLHTEVSSSTLGVPDKTRRVGLSVLSRGEVSLMSNPSFE